MTMTDLKASSTAECPICREIHEPTRGLSFDGQGVNSCGMYRNRLATMTDLGKQCGIGPDLARAWLIPELVAALREIASCHIEHDIVDGEEYRMSSDDVWETAIQSVKVARAVLAKLEG